MNFDNLKQLLIERALRGNLVPQIETELAVKQIGIQPDNVPFNVPEKWKWIYLESGVVEKIKYGYTASAAASGNARLLRISDIQVGKVLWETVPYCSIEKDKIASYEVKRGDIVVARTGGTIGKSFLINEEPERTVFASYLLRIRLGKSISAQYLYLFMQSRIYWAQLVKRSRGTGQPNVNATSLGKLLIPIPPLEEQHRIVARLESLLSDLTKAEKAYQELKSLAEQFREKILQQAICGRLVPQNLTDEPASLLLDRLSKKKNDMVKAGVLNRDRKASTIFRGKDNLIYEKVGGNKPICIEEKIPFEIPTNWKWERLKNIVNIVSAKRVHKSDWKSEGIPFYRAREIARLSQFGHVENELFISEDLFKTSSEYGLPQKGDLMVTAVGTLGKTYVVRESDRFYYKDASVLCFKNFGELDPHYLKIIMHSPFMSETIKNSSAGTTVGTLTIIKASEFLVPIPPLKEQHRIVAKVDRLFQQLDNLTL